MVVPVTLGFVLSTFVRYIYIYIYIEQIRKKIRFKVMNQKVVIYLLLKNVKSKMN